ncbi:hypothetical protein FHS10_000143 [Mucilaginibacter dorajii]|uniref:Uncharacterized protein n=1 Tax=Mucilaginibacter dorajii TaxID=692994 RepID=A0ABP7R0R3_9SPHI|nr:hypothetical protein [Mucilaginibacter dorajii]
MAFLNFERRSIRNLRSSSDGGFDIIYFQDDKFKHLNEATYIFYYVEISDIDILKPINVIYGSYSEGNVTVHTYSIETSKVYKTNHFKDKMPSKDNTLLFPWTLFRAFIFTRMGEYFSDLCVLYDIKPRASNLYNR